MSIFARTLLSFWIATALTLVMAGALLYSKKSFPNDQIRELPLEHLKACGRALVSAVELVPGLNSKSPTSDENCLIQYLISPTGRELHGKVVPVDISHMVDLQMHSGGTPLIEMRPGFTVISFRVTGRHDVYTAVAKVPQSDPPGLPMVFWLHLLCAIAISCVVFWLLARQLIQPIRTLQGIAESVAQGNLSHRPSKALLKRKDELGELSISIDFMVQKISQLMSSQKAFLAQVSHELGSPLTRLNLALALAKRKAAPALDSEFKRLEYESEELNSMIQQLLLLARLENATELNGSRELFFLSQVMREVAADATFEANQNEKGVLLSFSDLEDWDSLEILGYSDLLKRAFDNILRNAIRFTASRSSVEIRCSILDTNEAKITVRDFGVGVSPDQFGVIFEPFVRIPSGRNGSGTGLGLAIAKQAVIAHGGNVFADNADSGGLCITIQLPVTHLKLSTSDT